MKAVDSAQLPSRPAPCDTLSVPPSMRHAGCAPAATPLRGVTVMAAHPAAQKTQRVDARDRPGRCLATEPLWKAAPVVWEQRMHSRPAFPRAS